MSWASGSFTRLYGATGWVDDKNAATNILSSRHDAHDQDIADGVNACITRDNQAKPTADFLPSATATLNIGSSGVKWKNLYLSGDLTVTTGSFTATLTGMTGATTGTINYKIIGNMAHLWAQAAISGTSNSTSLALTGLPAALQPVHAVWTVSPVVNNSNVAQVSTIIAAAASTITFQNDDWSGINLFTASGTKGLPNGWQLSFNLT